MASDETRDDERARRAAAELKETEDLLAGFDRPGRPGRTPRVPAVKRDFVDYHLDKPRSGPTAPVSGAGAEDRARRDLPTAIIPNHKRRFPVWVPWAALLFVMSTGGVLVAAMMTSRPNTPTTSLPSAATSIASGAPAVDPTTGPARDIPPPPPPSNAATTEPSAAASSPEPSTATSTPATTGVVTATSSRRSTPSAPSSITAAPTSAPTSTATATPTGPAPSSSVQVDLIRNL